MATPLGNSDTALCTAADAALPRPRRVLLVANDGEALLRCAAQLEEAGLTVATARTGFEAIVKACWHLPDVIIMRQDLPSEPGVDGGVAAQLIRFCPATAHIPVVDPETIDRLQAGDLSTREFALLAHVARELSPAAVP